MGLNNTSCCPWGSCGQDGENVVVGSSAMSARWSYFYFFLLEVNVGLAMVAQDKLAFLCLDRLLKNGTDRAVAVGLKGDVCLPPGQGRKTDSQK